MSKIKKFIRDITGVTYRKEQRLLAELEWQKQKDESRIRTEKANKAIQQQKAEERKKKKEEKLRKQAEEDAKLSPKDLATKRKEPWVDVIGFRVNPDDVRFGFFEVDWNDFWVLKLKQEGYGADGDPDEEIISRWFRDILVSAAVSEGIDPETILAGSIDVKRVIQKNSEDS